MGAQALRWEPAPFTLSYRLGEVTLFRKRFDALVLRTHFLDLPADPARTAPSRERFGGGVSVVVTRSQPVAGDLPRVSADGGVLRYVFARYTRFHTDLSGDFDGYLAKFGGKTRGTLRRKVRKFLDANGGDAMREYRRPEDVEEFLRLARPISALTYQEKLFDAGLPSGPAFAEELKALAAQDALRAWLLFRDGEPIAYLCCPAADGVLLYRYLGYDPRHADLSPGTVLQYLAFESLFAERRFRLFDFTEGQGEHKRFFGTHETTCADICYLPATPANRFWVGLHAAVDGVSVALAATLDRLGVKARLKRFIRRL